MSIRKLFISSPPWVCLAPTAHAVPSREGLGVQGHLQLTAIPSCSGVQGLLSCTAPYKQPTWGEKGALQLLIPLYIRSLDI